MTRTPAPQVRATSRSRPARPGAGARGAAPGRAVAAADAARAGLSRPGRRDPGLTGSGEGGTGVLLAEHAEHPAHLIEGIPARRLDRAERLPGALGAHVDDVLAVARLHGDHRHAVRHHVVQFPCDPQPFLGDRAVRRLLLHRHRVQPALPGRVPGHPGDDAGERDRDEVTRPDVVLPRA